MSRLLEPNLPPLERLRRAREKLLATRDITRYLMRTLHNDIALDLLVIEEQMQDQEEARRPLSRREQEQGNSQ